MNASVPSIPLPPRRPPLWLVVPLALVWPRKSRPLLWAILWSRWRLAMVRLRYIPNTAPA